MMTLVMASILANAEQYYLIERSDLEHQLKPYLAKSESPIEQQNCLALSKIKSE